MSIVAGAIDAGFLGVTGFGVWSGKSLWGRHIELKHERELAKLSVKRMAKSAELEMALTRNLAEIEQMKTMPALSSGESVLTSSEPTFDPSGLPFVCGCKKDPSWHLHAVKGTKEHTLPLSLGAITALRDGHFQNLCICDKRPNVVHAYKGGTGEPNKSLSAAGFAIGKARND